MKRASGRVVGGAVETCINDTHASLVLFTARFTETREYRTDPTVAGVRRSVIAAPVIGRIAVADLVAARWPALSIPALGDEAHRGSMV